MQEAPIPEGFKLIPEEAPLPQGFTLVEDQNPTVHKNIKAKNLPGINRRQRGRLYQTPNGPAYWQPDGWLMPSSQDRDNDPNSIDAGPEIPKPRKDNRLRSDDEMGIRETPGSLSRFMGSASEGFLSGYGDAPLIDIDGPEKLIPSPEGVAVKLGEGALRTLGGVFKAGTHVGSQVARELGMSDADARQLERGLTGMIDTAGMMTVGTNVASQGARSINKAQRNAGRLDDVKAFDRVGVQPFAPALSETPLQKHLTHATSKVPVAGGPINERLTDLTKDTANAANRIADDLSPSRIDSLEEGGQILQRGLERYSKESVLSVPIETMTDGQIRQMIIGRSSKGLSFTTKQEAMYENAWRKLPARSKSNGAINPDLVATSHSRKVLRNLIRNRVRIGVSGGAFQGKFSGLSEKLMNRGSLQIETLRKMRTEIGRIIGNGNVEDVNLSRGELKELYGSITRDITDGMEAIARRAAADPNVTSANRFAAGDAVRAFKRADQYTKAGHARMDKLLGLTKAKTPEQAADKLLKAGLSKGTGNLGMLRAAKKSISPDEWSDMGSLVFRRLGNPNPGVSGIKQDVSFSPAAFSTAFNKMSANGKDVMFGAKGNHARDAIEALARVSDRVKGFEAMGNHSNTMSQGITAISSVGILGSVTGQLIPITAFLSGAYGYSKLASSPQFARWLARAVELSVRPNSSRMMAAQLTQLQVMTERDPGLRPLLEALK